MKVKLISRANIDERKVLKSVGVEEIKWLCYAYRVTQEVKGHVKSVCSWELTIGMDEGEGELMKELITMK